MKLDKDSHGTILAVWGIALGLVALCFLLTDILWVRLLVAVPLGVLALFVVYFFRVPRRSGPGDGMTVTSVADGEIVIVDRAYEGEFLHRECRRVCVYMDFFDVHANFWPVTGEVVACAYYPGEHARAFQPKSSDGNEHFSTVIRTPGGQELLFKQIAGTYARRVVSYAKPGLKVQAGEQCGVIKLGSRIDFYLPLEAEVQVRVGDRVRAVESVIALLPSPKEQQA